MLSVTLSKTRIVPRLGYDIHLIPIADGIKFEVYNASMKWLIAYGTASNEANAIELADFEIDRLETLLTSAFDAKYPPVETCDQPEAESLNDPAVAQIQENPVDTVQQPPLQRRQYRNPVQYVDHVWIAGKRANACFLSYSREKQRYQVDWYLSDAHGSLIYCTSEYITDPHEKHMLYLWIKNHRAAAPVSWGDVQQAFNQVVIAIKEGGRLQRNSRQITAFNRITRAWWQRYGETHANLLDDLRQRWKRRVYERTGLKFPISKRETPPPANRAIRRNYAGLIIHKWERDNDIILGIR